MNRKLPRLLVVAVVGLMLTAPLSATTVLIDASKDNTLYESPMGLLSNGSGNHLFIGRTSGQEKRRALLAFNNLSAIPAEATITSVKLHIYVNKEKSAMTTVNLARVTQDWGEGESQAADEEGKGGDPVSGDATWIHAKNPEVTWNNPGGDFSEVASATLQIDATGTYTFGSTPQMIADVEDWLDNPGNNFGWILIAGENGQTSKRLHSRDNSEADSRPMLEVTYSLDGDDTPLVNDFSGLWYDQSLEGEGYNVIKSPFGWMVYFYGYDKEGQRLWLVTELLKIEDFQLGFSYGFKVYVGTPGTFDMPSPSDDLVEWGTLQINFDNCTTGTFVLESDTELLLKISSVTKLLGVEGTQCLNV